MKKIITMIVLMALALPTIVAQEPAEEVKEPAEEVTQEPAEEVTQEAQQEAPQEAPQETPQKKQTQNTGEVQTLFGSNTGNGGYGAFTIGYTSINSKDALLMGARGEWVIGHSFGLGLGGYGFVNDPTYNPFNDLNYSLAGGYGGLIIEPILFGWFPVHLSLPIMIGGGGVALASYYSDPYNSYNYYDGYVSDAAAFFVAEFTAEVEFNLVRFFRLAVFGSYRYTSDILLENTPADALRGWSAGMTFKFGSF